MNSENEFEPRSLAKFTLIRIQDLEPRFRVVGLEKRDSVSLILIFGLLNFDVAFKVKYLESDKGRKEMMKGTWGLL